MKLAIILKHSLSIKIAELYDDAGMNLLHHCVLKESIGKTKYLIEFAKKEGTSPLLLK
jgi:hypothetical protein